VRAQFASLLLALALPSIAAAGCPAPQYKSGDILTAGAVNGFFGRHVVYNGEAWVDAIPALNRAIGAPLLHQTPYPTAKEFNHALRWYCRHRNRRR